MKGVAFKPAGISFAWRGRHFRIWWTGMEISKGASGRLFLFPWNGYWWRLRK